MLKYEGSFEYLQINAYNYENISSTRWHTGIF